jgi:hypothetical protein
MVIAKIHQHTITHQNGKLHSSSHPALMHPDYQEWSLNGVYHRGNGPARLFRIAPDGQKLIAEWWMNGKFIHADVVSPELFETYWHHNEVEPDMTMLADGTIK